MSLRSILKLSTHLRLGLPSGLFPTGCMPCPSHPPWFRGFLRSFITSLFFYGVELLAPLSTPKLEDHPLSTVRDCLFNIFAATSIPGGRLLHPQPEDAPCRGEKEPTYPPTSLD
jgi:hypothetical protein